MNEEKQIEEMAKDLCKYSLTEYCASGRCQNPNCLVNAKALEILCGKGYRRASSVAEEIFVEIDSLLEIDEKDFDEVFEQSRSEDEDNVSLALSNYVYGIRRMFAELKKKYTKTEEIK